MIRCIAFTTLCAALFSAFSGDAIQFKQEKSLPLSSGGGFDYVSIEPVSRRVLVAHSTRIEVFDADKGDKLGVVEGVEGAHGAIIVPEIGLGFATAGKKNALLVFDAKTYKVTKEIATGDGPDALLFVSATKEVWTMNHKAGTVTCVDATTLEVKATIEVGGKLEFGVEYLAQGLVFVNAEDKNFVAEIDAKKHTLVARIPLAPAESPTGLAIDQKHGILFAGCDKMMAVVDIAGGKVIATPAIGDGCDAAVFDADSNLAFASCGDGTTTIVREVDGKTFEVAGKIDTAAGARTCAIDPKTHNFWVCAGTRGKDDARLLVFGRVTTPPQPVK
jgi:YVTN family beta-propeller protein